MQPIKYYNLPYWAKAVHWDDVLTFKWMDWAYAHWNNEQGELRIGSAEYYELKEDGMYYPVSE